MAIGASMNTQDDSSCKHDEHDLDLVMPGFRFHPTEEELVEFYLRRKVEGKRFNVELITCVDLYRYDPWELPGLATIGEKEWYFYVPRDRKYRNGDRPNRVTTSGYWKATGADRMIRSENLRSIGLKKTLVFYTGKAPKGIRTSWIMNEYRLPQHDTERLQKAEISLCRVYKRAGVDDHRYRARTLPAKSSSSSSSRVSQPRQDQPEPKTNQSAEVIQASYGESSQQNDGKIIESSPSSSTDMGTFLALSHDNSSYSINPLVQIASSPHAAIDDLHKIVNNYSQQQPAAALSTNQDPSNNDLFHNPLTHFPGQQTPLLAINFIQASLPAAFSDRFLDWNGIADASKNYTSFSSN